MHTWLEGYLDKYGVLDKRRGQPKREKNRLQLHRLLLHPSTLISVAHTKLKIE